MTDPAPLSAPPGTPTIHDFEPLSAAEALVVRAIAHGDIAKVSYRRPRTAGPDTQVRAALLAVLARSAGPGLHRLEVMGAAVVGCLNVTAATLPVSLWLYRCSFDTAPLFDRAHVRGSLSFVDCAMPGLHAEGCRIDGDLAIGAGSQVSGAIGVARAQIAGDLDLDRLRLREDAPATRGLRSMFVADALDLGGDVKLLGGAEVVGETRFVGARIGGHLRLSGARLTADIDEAGARGVALNLDRVQVAGNVAIDAGFSSAGQVRARQAQVGGDFDASDADLDAVGDASWGEDGGALMLDRARIGGTLSLRRLQQPLQGASLADAEVGTLHDDSNAWGQHHVLDGFTYRRFADDAPVDAQTRLEWLARQWLPHLGHDFKPGPWRTLIAVLRNAGHAGSADALAIGRERHLRRIGAIGGAAPAPLRGLVRMAHGAFGALAGYGLRPWRLLAVAAGVWLGCAAAYWAATDAFAPSTALLAAAPRAIECPPDCSRLPISVTPLQPLLYSLDVLLPFADLQQQRHWAPARGVIAVPLEEWVGTPLLRLLVGAEALFGWAALGLAIAIAAGWTDRDRRR